MPRLAAQLALAALALLAQPASAQRRQARHFFGPPAVGFGVGILSVHRRFPVAASIVSRRASRSYSHQYHYQATPVGEHGYQTSSYTESDHYYSSANLRYYQPNVYHYHSTPWHYRWGRSTDVAARKRREERLIEIGDLDSIPLDRSVERTPSDTNQGPLLTGSVTWPPTCP